MKENKPYLEKIAAYLSGNLSKPEQEEVENWRDASPGNGEEFAEAKRIWENSGARLGVVDVDTSQEWSRLQSRIADDSASANVIPLSSYNSFWLKIAASVILVAGALYFFWPSGNTEKMVIINSGNEVATIYLPDSSKVWLNIESELSYPEDFGKEGRTASISGEGYFKVRPDSTKPFIVQTSLALAKVLGTSFDVKEDSGRVILTVAEGKVSFSSLESANEEIVMAREKAVLTADDSLAKSPNDDPAFLAWREHNNSIYEEEKQNPKAYLTNHYSWEKNKLNMSVIEGKLVNHADVAIYTDIVLKVTYTKPNGHTSTSTFTITERVPAGETVPYQKRLLDIFTDTQSVVVEIESAKVISSAAL